MKRLAILSALAMAGCDPAAYAVDGERGDEANSLKA